MSQINLLDQNKLRSLVYPEFLSFFSQNFINQNNYTEQSESLKMNLNYLNNSVPNLENELFGLEEKINKFEKDIILKNVEINLLEVLKNYKLESKKEFILNTINSALHMIFEDQISIDILQEVTKAGKIKYNIVFYQNGLEIGKNNDLLETNGGGVLSVISFLFKILIGYLYSKNKFFIFDESFAQVSPQYREKLSLFLRDFAEKFGFTIVLVSQTADLNTYAHRIYKVNYKYEDEVKSLYIEKIEDQGGEDIDEIYYVKIKNFQSIKNIEFEYKGLTIISGPNNSGKSASLRAVKSIIFNDFSDKFKRINSKITEVIFGKKIVSKNFDYSIKMIYKSKKIIYEINGEQYLGKNLAADVVKNEIEKIGFKYIDIKKLYKNIKGDLKEQTEKIAYSSQHDSLFLIGSKSNDIEKVFNFLFNTEYITQAIIDIKNQISEINTELNYLNKNKEEVSYKLKGELAKLYLFDLYYNVVQFKLLKEKSLEDKKLKDSINKINLEVQRLDKSLVDYNSIYQRYNEISPIKYKELLTENTDLKNKKKLIQDQLSKIDINIKEKIDLYLKYIEYLNLSNSIENTKKKIDKNLKIDQSLNTILNSNIQEKTQILQQYQMYLKYLDIIKKYKSDLLEINNKIDNINEDQIIENEGYIKCSCCSGFGYHKKGENE